jgi:hypothetical protein
MHCRQERSAQLVQSEIGGKLAVSVTKTTPTALPASLSAYHWKGDIEDDDVFLILKDPCTHMKQGVTWLVFGPVLALVIEFKARSVSFIQSSQGRLDSELIAVHLQ